MPLVSVLVAIELIAGATTKTGLQIRCELDRNVYPKGIKVSDEELATLNIKRDKFHPRMELRHCPAKSKHGAVVFGRRLTTLIRRSFVEIPRRPLPTREGTAFVAIKARELHCDRLDALLQPKRLTVFI